MGHVVFVGSAGVATSSRALVIPPALGASVQPILTTSSLGLNFQKVFGSTWLISINAWRHFSESEKPLVRMSARMALVIS